MNKIKILKIIILFINLIVMIRLFDVMIIKNKEYIKKSEEITSQIIYSSSAPRGRILDKNGKVLVDNKGIKVLTYKKTGENQLELVKSLASILNINNIKVSNDDLKKYYYECHKEEINKLLDKKIIDKYNSKVLSKEEYLDYKDSFIKDLDLIKVNNIEAYIYNIINNGYSFEEKIIKSDLSEEELNKINALNSSSLNIGIRWVRVFNYDTCLNDLFGSIGKIESEKLKYYLDRGYSLDDTVGVSFLEYYYEDYLKGEKASYKLLENGEKKLISEEKRGNDLVLSIDINTQLKVEEILKNEVREVKKYPSSKYYNGSFVIVSDPFDGSIDAIAGYDYDDEFKSTVIETLTSSYALGSVVKGASQTVSFNAGVINTKKKVLDGCVKLKNMPPKCSWARLGYLSDIDALRQSSNYYQFINAIKVAGYEYTYNMNFKPSEEVFNTYRNTFKSYGLGDYSGIDLYEEDLGMIGKRRSGDLLLNYVIGQYDTYTPLMLSSYINTLATGGVRYNLRLVDYGIDKNNNKIGVNDAKILNKVEVKREDMLRIQEGLHNVILRGTGSGYINPKYDAAGKTGTSETFYNGIPTTTRSFITYAPFSNPEYSIVIISPNLKYKNNINNYSYPINSRLSRQISNILFEK